MNVLVMSISNKVPMLKAVKDAMERLGCYDKLFGADTNSECTGRYFVDQFWACPSLSELSPKRLIQYCQTHAIKLIIPTRDGELLYFAEHRRLLSGSGIAVMISELEAVQLCLDKQLFYERLKANGYPVIPTHSKVLETAGGYVVKERYGAGSVAVGINLDAQAARRHASKLQHPIFQPYIQGTEYSVDVYVSNRTAIAAIVRERRLIVRGESHITCSLNHPELEALCMNMAESFPFIGHILFQVIVDERLTPHIVECNARFGGASTLSLAMGLDSFYWFMQESMGARSDKLEFKRSDKELTMVRHAEDLIL